MTRVSIASIQQAVCDHYGLALTAMRSDRRSPVVAQPRQLAYYLCRELTEFSLPVIGHFFADRDHTTILHGVRAVEERLKTDRRLRKAAAKIRAEVTGEPEPKSWRFIPLEGFTRQGVLVPDGGKNVIAEFLTPAAAKILALNGKRKAA